MKKKIIIIISVVLLLSIIVFSFNFLIDYLDEKTFELAYGNETQERQAELSEQEKDWSIIKKIPFRLMVFQFRKEEALIEERTEKGLPVWGKDTLLIWEEKYDIVKSNTSKNLCIYINKLTYDVVRDLSAFDVKGNQLYVVANEAYAIVDKDNLCRVFLRVPEEKYSDGIRIDEDGNISAIGRKIEDEHIIYLDSFDDFSIKERKHLKKMEEEH